MKARNSNSNLWSENIQWRYNGAISIGYLLCVIATMPIKKLHARRCSNDKKIPVILLKFPKKFPSVYINNAPEGNSSLAFVYKKVHLNICYSGAVCTSCT